MNPSFLWALLGLSIPLLIHLWSKKQGKTVKIGSIKFLKASASKKSSRIQLNELFLLLLRMLLISITVIILSETRLANNIKNAPLVYVVESSLLNSPKVKTLVDSLSLRHQVRLLQPKLPIYISEEKNATLLDSPKYWQLAREMESLKADSLVVFTQAYLKNIQGKRPTIQKNINWISLTTDETSTHIAGILTSEATEEMVSVVSQPNRLKFQRETRQNNTNRSDSILVVNKDSIQVNLFADKNLEANERYLKATFSAIATYLDHPILLSSIDKNDEIELSTSDILVWLSEEPIPKTKAKVLKFREDDLAKTMIESGTNPNEFFLTQNLNSENIINQHLGDQLLAFLNLYPELENEADTYDHRVIDLASLRPAIGEKSDLRIEDTGQDFSHYLWIAFLIVMLSERTLSKYRKQ